MAKKIRDTIHGYIYLTKVEEAVSQHPLVLRMHYVHQTSFTYLTYPNAHSTRYPHSLGVMHVAGEIFHSAIVNTPRKQISHLVTIVSDYLSSNEIDIAQILQELAGQHEQLYEMLRQTTKQRANSSPETAAQMEDAGVFVPLALLFQAVRLAAMLHDIGHPPFSHIVEYSLLQASGQGSGQSAGAPIYLGHEKVGSELMRLIETDGNLRLRSGFKNTPTFSSACLKLSRAILEATEDSNFYGIKESLLSGQIDADRLDYVRRDAHAAGMVPSYDIRRLVDAAFFRLENGKVEIGYRPNCLSSFENFFFARYDLYRYMIYHHDVIRRNLAIQRLLSVLLVDNSELDPAVQEIGRKFTAFATGNVPKKYAAYDRFVDSYFLTMLWELDDLVHEREGLLVNSSDKLKYYLNLVLRRRNDLLRTLFKRPDNYSSFVEEVLLEARLPDKPADVKAVPHFNTLLRGRLEKLKRDHGRKDNVAKFMLAGEIEESLNSAVSASQTRGIFYCYYLGTFSAGPGRKVWFSEPDRAERVVAEDVSPTIAMLEEAWNFSPQLIVFFHRPLADPPINEEATHDIMRAAAVAGMKKYLISIC